MENLTKEQESQVSAYADKMLRNGIKCGVKTDRARAKAVVELLYTKYLDQPVVPIKFVDSPEAAIAAVSKSTGIKPKDLVKEVFYCNLWTWWIAYYHAGIKILGESSGEPDLDAACAEYEAITHDVHALLPCEKVCYVIEYPKHVKLLNDDLEAFKLHREGGLAFEYRDGTGFAWLNGVEVPDYVAVTPPGKLSVKKLLGETNVDVRREGLRRVPLEKLLKATKAKLLDKEKDLKKGLHWDYQLYEMDLGDGKKRVFLRMFDVASQTYAVERVEDACKTVLEALAWRDGEGEYRTPSIRT